MRLIQRIRMFPALLAGVVTLGLGLPGGAAAQDGGDLRLVIEKSERKLYVYLGDDLLETHPVAIGKDDHPTPTGEFGIHQVDWNPDWTPPDSDWAADSEYKEPGDPDNPMGRVRMIYRAPYSLHGTDVLDSLGRAASHGSIRVANETIMELARLVMEHGGAEREEAWFEEAIANADEMREVHLPDPVPLVIRD